VLNLVQHHRLLQDCDQRMSALQAIDISTGIFSTSKHAYLFATIFFCLTSITSLASKLLEHKAQWETLGKSCSSCYSSMHLGKVARAQQLMDLDV
jgi:hypothetical protein